jgi:hypothetical protein
MRYLGGHLGVAVSALVDGQLDAASAERAWVHVHGCGTCRRQVEREGWVKTQLASMPGDEGPPPQLLGSLYSLGRGAEDPDPAVAWAAVEELERRGRGRRRTGIAVVGAGSVSAAVLGLASLTGSTLGIGGAATTAPSTAPTMAPTAVIAPVARVHGRLPLDRPVQDESHDGLRP